MAQLNIATVSTKGQFTIPSGIRDEYDIKQGTKLLVIPLKVGIVLKPIEIPSIEQIRTQVDQRDDEIHVTVHDLDRLLEKVRREDPC